MTGLGRGAAAVLWVLAGVTAIAAHAGLGFVAVKAMAGPSVPSEPKSQPAALRVTRIVLDTSPPPPPPAPPAPAPAAKPERTLETLMSDARRIERPGIGLPTASEAVELAEAAAAASAISLSADASGNREAAPQVPRAGMEAVVDVLRGHTTGSCFAAVARDHGDGGLKITFLGIPDGGTAGLADDLQTAAAQPIALREHPVTPQQCPALAFLRNAAAYPGGRLSLVLDTVEISSGGALAGRITGQADGAAVHVMLIDDAGLVQRLDGFLVPDPAGGLRFSIPLSLQGTPVTSAQLVLAVTAPSPLPVLATLTAAEAVGLFAVLGSEFTAAGPRADFALAAFTLR